MNISSLVSNLKITDFYTRNPANNFCQCGKVLATGEIACMPIKSAEPLALTIVKAHEAQRWAIILVNPNNGETVATYNRRWYDSPCEAMRVAASFSADGHYPIRIDLCSDQSMDWGLLVDKVSQELVERGAWLAERNPSVNFSNNEHPITLRAFKDAIEQGYAVLLEVENV